MKIDRLIGIITILLQKDQVTAPELAERFEVSRRTINRDIEDICQAGIPLVTTQGYGGGISIADGFKVDHTLLTQEELQLVFSGLKGLDSVSERSHSLRLAEKLSATAINTVDTMVIDLAAHYQKPLTQKISAIQEAIQNKRHISFCLFKLNRLWDLETGTNSFVPRDLPDLELDQYFSAGGIHLKALFEENQKYRLIEEYGPDCFQIGPKGRLLFERDFVSFVNLREWVLSFGSQVEVLEPERLRADLRRQAEKMLEIYQEHDI